MRAGSDVTSEAGRGNSAEMLRRAGSKISQRADHCFNTASHHEQNINKIMKKISCLCVLCEIHPVTLHGQIKHFIIFFKYVL